MALTLLRLFETKTPLLPVAVAGTVSVVVGGGGVVGKKEVGRAVAATMPASVDDYVWTYTESGEGTLRPVVVAVGGGGGGCDANVAGRF
jgi:hypothetical protein